MQSGEFFLRKQTLFLISAILLSGGVVGAMVYLRGAKTTPTPGTLTAQDARDISERMALSDSDHDGLPDWEEQLRGTNPRDADSDGDGTTDGDEVRENRNPALAGADVLETNDTFSYNNMLSASSTPNLTEDVAKQLYTNLIALDQFGKNDVETKKKLVLKTAESIAEVSTPPAFDPSVLTTTSDISKERALRYKSDIAEAMAPFQVRGENELMLIGKIIDRDDPVAKATLNELLGKYQTLINTLTAMEIPEDARAVHATLIQSFIAYSYALQGMSVLHQDALRATLASQQFSNALLTLDTTIKALGVYFRGKGIV